MSTPPPTEPTKNMHITKITVGRIYNLGNYEHVRYELTVEVKEGESATRAIVGIERLLAGLKPIERLGVPEQYEIDRDEKEVEAMRKMPVAEWERRYGHCVGTPSEVIRRYEEGLADKKERRGKRRGRARLARIRSADGTWFWHMDHGGKKR